jgi:sulfate adenylyltransferase subunit 1
MTKPGLLIYQPVFQPCKQNWNSKMPWYAGKTLLEHLETVDVSGGEAEAGFYMPVQRVCRPDHTFRGFQGQIEAGGVSVGDTLTALPSGELAIVKSIHVADKQAQRARLGQSVTIQLDREVDVSRGCVFARDTALQTAKEFEATLLWMDDAPLTPGKDYWAKAGTRLVPAIVTKIRHKVDVNSGESLPVSSVGKNDLVKCDIVLSEPAVIDEFRLHRTLGELILIDRVSYATTACGVIDGISRAIPGSRAYPDDFDIPLPNGFANVRSGVITGFGGRDIEYPLIEFGGGSRGGFRLLCLWNKDGETDYEI